MKALLWWYSGKTGQSICTGTLILCNLYNSGSMEPAFQRGDLLVLSLPKNEPIQVNDICVFKLPERPVPIVHRVIKLHDE